MSIRLHAPSDTTKPAPAPPFFSMDSHILMQKASKDNVALFQHAILGYYTTPSRGLLPDGAHRARPERSCMHY